MIFYANVEKYFFNNFFILLQWSFQYTTDSIFLFLQSTGHEFHAQ